MKKKTFLIVLVFVLLVFVFAGFPFFKKPSEANHIERVGVIEATEVHLSSKISERIKELSLKEGDSVQSDAVAVRLEDQQIKAEMAQAEANVQRGEAGRLNAKAQIEKAKAALQDSKRNLTRISQLQEEGLVSTSDLERAQTRFELAEAELRAAEAEFRSAEAEIKQRLAHLQLIQIQLDEAQIHSPISGVVTLKAFEVGEMVSPGATILTLIDPDSVWARVDLEEGEVGKVRLGDRAEIFADSVQGASFEAEVVEIGAAGGFATQRDATRGRQDVKTFRVKVQAASPKGFLKPGMTARVRILLNEGTEGNTVGRAAN
jgi:HlyD family secretion protein